MCIPTSHSGNEVRDQGEMTAMIDIVFLLLIFFICAAAGSVRESVLATDLAPAGSVAAATSVVIEQRDPIQIETFLKLMRDPDHGTLLVTLNDQEFADLDRLEAVLQTMASIDASNPVVLDMADDITLGEMIDLYDRCRRAGLESVNFAADAVATGTPAPPLP